MLQDFNITESVAENELTLNFMEIGKPKVSLLKLTYEGTSELRRVSGSAEVMARIRNRRLR